MTTCINTNTACRLSICDYCNPSPKLSIKDKAYALAKEHNIELFVKGVILISLPKGFELPDGTTGWGGEWDDNLTWYQMWKHIYADVADLVERKSTWREIEMVGA